MAMPSGSRLIRILQDLLETQQLESSDTKETILNNFSDEQRQLLGDAMTISWEVGYQEGYQEGHKDAEEHNQGNS